MRPFLAMIMPVGEGGAVDPGYGVPAPRPPTGGQPGVPTHPIYNPAYPDQGLPGSQPYPDQGLPGNQPYPDQGLPGSQPRPDNTLPGQGSGGGRPSHPIYIPGGPSHPIVIPPPRPDQGLPGEQPKPDNTLPPIEGLPPTTEDGKPIEWKAAWLPATGWIVVGIPQFEHPTPSK